MSEASSLHKKLAEITAQVGYVAKDGRNDFQGYNYTSAEALLATIRGPLSSRGLTLTPALSHISEREYTTSKGKASVITTAYVKFTFTDSETGEREESLWAGQGDDPADKGLGKAFTNAIKTFLREQFQIPQGDDPEADRATDERSRDRAPAAQQQSGDKLASESQKRLIFARMKDAGIPNSVLANIMLIAAGKEATLFETEADAESWIERALPRLPARLVNPIVENIMAEKVLA